MASLIGVVAAAREVTGVVPPPAGIASSTDALESRAMPVIISSLVCWAVATLALGMRVYARAKLQRRFELTDCERILLKAPSVVNANEIGRFLCCVLGMSTAPFFFRPTEGF
jgi:hypothetical protein